MCSLFDQTLAPVVLLVCAALCCEQPCQLLILSLMKIWTCLATSHALKGLELGWGQPICSSMLWTRRMTRKLLGSHLQHVLQHRLLAVKGLGLDPGVWTARSHLNQRVRKSRLHTLKVLAKKNWTEPVLHDCRVHGSVDIATIQAYEFTKLIQHQTTEIKQRSSDLQAQCF